MFKATIVALALMVATPLPAADMPGSVHAYIYADLMRWINAPKIVDALKRHSYKSERLSQADLRARNLLWQANQGKGHVPLVRDVLSAPISSFLRTHEAASDGRIRSVSLMDRRGVQVAASAVPPAYWQGNHHVFQEITQRGSGAIVIEQDQGTGAAALDLRNVSFAVTEPFSGDVIGVLTVQLDISAFP